VSVDGEQHKLTVWNYQKLGLGRMAVTSFCLEGFTVVAVEA